MQGDPGEKVPEFAGKRIRYAEVAVKLDNRKPVEIIRIIFPYLQFSSDGRLDAEYLETETRLRMESLPPIPNLRDLKNVIDASHRFAEKTLRSKFQWQPTREIALALYEDIFGTS